MKRSLLLLICLLGLLPGRTSATVLDWNTVSWTSGTLTLGYDIDPSNPGTDITVTVTPNGGSFVWQNGSPVDNTSLNGGYGTSAQSLFLGVDWTSRTQTMTVAINFNYAQGVSNVSFSLFDIDQASGGANVGYVDQISKITAQYNNGTLDAATLTHSPDNALAGTGTNQTITGTATATDTTSNGNASISFGTNIVTSATFTYGNSSSAPSSPGIQWIGLYDITYTARPRMSEVHPGIVAASFCVGLLGCRWARRRRVTLNAKSPDQAIKRVQ